MSEWQPIETAPRDGTPVLLWAVREGWEDRGPCRICGWGDEYGWSLYGAAGAEPFAGMPRNNRVQRLDQCQPTHWMPLPAPPDKGET